MSYETERAYAQYKDNMDTLAVSKTLVQFVKTQRVNFDYTDLFRWQLVQTVSSMDKYFHDLIIAGISFRMSINEPTDRMLNFGVSYENIGSQDLVKNAFGNYLAHQAFQNSNKISEGLSFIWNEPHKWIKIQNQIDIVDVRKSIDLISSRRNQIVHQSDFQVYSFDRQEINENDIVDCEKAIRAVVNCVHELVEDSLTELSLHISNGTN